MKKREEEKIEGLLYPRNHASSLLDAGEDAL
jgi:hypothetical protein